MRRGFAFGAAVLFAALTAAPSEAAAPRTIDPSHPGYVPYRQYCASCHGVFADGHGPVAPVLKKAPADLTRLGEKYGLPLPKARLLRFIDGRETLRAHGTSDMPVWGKRLYEEIPSGPALEFARRGTLLSILDYLEALQRPPTK